MQEADYTPLLTFLRPLQKWLEDPEVKDIHIRRPGVIWVKTTGGKDRHEVPELNFKRLMSIAEIAATIEGKRITEETPWLDCSFPGGARVHIKIPPFTAPGTVSVAIRLPRAQNWTLDQVAARGTFARTKLIQRADCDPELAALTDVPQLLHQLVLRRRTIGVTGSVGSGKTTLMNALLKLVPLDECVITVQDVSEVDLPHEDWSQSFVSFTSNAVTAVDPSVALRSALRDDGDRLFVGELRGAEAAMWLNAINTGYAGSIASWHANIGLEAACQRLADMITDANPQGDNRRLFDQSLRYIDCVVHMRRDVTGKVYECAEISYR